MTKPLADIRLEIDEIDQQLVRLIASRGELVKQACQVKKTAQEVEAPDRVAQVIDKVSRYALETGADVRLVETLYRQMIAGFIQLEHQVVKKRD